MVSFKQIEKAVRAARPTQDEIRKEVERLRIEVGLATMHTNQVIIENAEIDVEVQVPAEAAIRGFNSPDDFVVKQGSLKYNDGGSYQGELLGNFRHGEGTFVQANGTRYTGQWRYDLLEGRGRAVTASGQVFEGEFRNGRAHGQGTAVYEDGGRYEGDWEADGRHGWGRHTYPSGDVYEGEWAEDVISGHGRLTKTDGSFYEGTWEAGSLVQGRWTSADGGEVYDGEWRGWERHGHGVLFIDRMFKYEGGFESGERHGQGRCEWVGGGVYEGSWRAGQRHGLGSFSERDLRYEGEWAEDVFHGEGLLVMDSGERYRGGFERGQRHGFGRWISADGDKYQGQWVQGKRNGQGTCVYANGDVYTGEWAGGVRCGTGRCVFADGSAFSGRWEDDGWVQSAADPVRCDVEGPGVTRAVAGEASRLAIRAVDEDGQPRLCGGDEFQVRLVLATEEKNYDLNTRTGEKGGENVRSELVEAPEAVPLPPPLTVTAEVNDRDDGTYEVSYTAEVAGVYELHVTAGAGGAEPVAASPYPLRVLPAAPAAKKTVITGQGRSVAAVSSCASFSIELRDEFGNLCAAGAAAPVAARLEGPAGLEVPVTLTPSVLDGLMSASYVAPDAVGLYRLHVEWAGVALPGTPFSVAVLAEGEVDRHVAAAASNSKKKNRRGIEGEGSSETEGEELADPTAAAAAAAGVAAAAPPDRMALWDRIAAAAYVAVDGGTDGWDSDEEERKKNESKEDAYVAAHPDVPVVESLEDLWLVSKLQNERKAKAEEEKRKKLDAVRAALEGAYGPGQAPSAEEAEAALRDILAAEKAKEGGGGGEQGGKGSGGGSAGAPPPTPAPAEAPGPAPRTRWGGRAAMKAAAATLDDLA